MKKNKFQIKGLLLSMLVLLVIQALLLSYSEFCLAATYPVQVEASEIALEFQKINNDNTGHGFSQHKNNKEVNPLIMGKERNSAINKAVVGLVSIIQISKIRLAYYIAEKSQAPPKYYNQICSFYTNPNYINKNSSVFLFVKSYSNIEGGQV